MIEVRNARDVGRVDIMILIVMKDSMTELTSTSSSKVRRRFYYIVFGKCSSSEAREKMKSRYSLKLPSQKIPLFLNLHILTFKILNIKY